MAQLSVSGNNYIYATTSSSVSDLYLFVEDDVNIENTNSFIYLRSDAQLLQGTGITGNSGVGQLSTYQNGTVHNYAYNYWCSPVGNTDSDSNSNRSFRPNNNIYDVTSAPITSSLATYTSSFDGTSSPLVISNRWIYTYNPGSSYSDWDFTNSSGNVSPGYGFTMKGTSGSSNNQLYDFRGKPNNGTLTMNVLDKEWTLVGNPYPSALDALEFIHDTQNQLSINGSLYYWEQDLTVNSHNLADYVGGYAAYTITSDGATETFTPATFDTYNNDGSLNTSGSSSSSEKVARRYIPIGQGFMVEGTTTGTVRTTNDQRVYYKQSDTQSEFFGAVDFSEDTSNDQTQSVETTSYGIQYDENGLQILPSEYRRFRLNIDFDETYTRQILQNFHESATNGFDYGLEIKSPEGVNSDAHWIQHGEPFVAQAFAFNENLKIPLAINVNSQQLIRFRIFDVQNFEANQTIYLHDKEKGTFVDLTVQNYETNLESGEYSDRFEITFINEALDIVDSEINELNIFQNNTKAQLTINNPNNVDIKEVTLFDINGKQIFKHLDLTPKNKYRFSTQNLSEGVYLATLRVNNNTITKKVIISN
jgi:hypothetical protein